jgi:hypothetical protein
MPGLARRNPIEMTENNHPTSPPDPAPSEPRALIPYPVLDDEIDLIGLGASLWRRWKLMLVIFLLCTGLGLALAFTQPRTYSYTAVVGLGARLITPTGDVVPIESPKSAVTVVEKAFLPAAIRRVAASQGIKRRSIRIKVENPLKTNLVVLSGKGPLKFAAAYKQVELEAANALVARDAPVIRILQGKIEHSLAQAQNQLALLQNQTVVQANLSPLRLRLLKSQLSLQGLKNKAAYQQKILGHKQAIATAEAKVKNLQAELQAFAVRKSSLDAARKLYQAEIKELKVHLVQVRQAVRTASAKLQTPAQAAAVLLLSTEEQRTFKQRNLAEQNLLVNLPQQFKTVENKITATQRELVIAGRAVDQYKQALASFLASHQRKLKQASASVHATQVAIPSFQSKQAAQIANQKAAIQVLKVRLANLNETKLAAPPGASIDPAGLPRSVVAILGAVVGVFLALLAAALVNYVVAVRRRLAPENS